MDGRWRIELLGGLRAVQGEQAVRRFQTQKTAALLAYLAFDLDRAHPRAELIELLWPESEVDAGRNRLSVALTSLRRQLEPPGVPQGAVIAASRTTVQLRPTACTTDVAEFEAAVQAAARPGAGIERGRKLEEAVALYHGELLPGFFEAWILPERQRLAELYHEALEQLVAVREEAGDLAGALQWARRLVSADPLREEAHFTLIRLLAAGHPEAALHQYAELQRLMSQELGSTPAAEIRAFAEGLRRQGTGDWEPAPRTAVSSSLHPAASLPGGPAETALALTGTVTFLLCERAGEDPAEHSLELVRSLFRGYGGHEARVTAEHLSVAFGRASDALAAAVAAQQALDRHGPAPRIALHTGEMEPGEETLHTPVLRHAERLLGAAHPGQILLTEETASLLRREPAPDIGLRDLGRHRLHEGGAPEPLFLAQPAAQAGRPSPPPNALPPFEGHLPPQFTRFFGREEEITRLCELLGQTGDGRRETGDASQDSEVSAEAPLPARRPSGRSPFCHRPSRVCRPVTPTGPGGSGKTRLALEVAQRLHDRFRGAVWFVPLQDLIEPRLIPDKLLAALRLPRSPQIQPLEQAVSFLSRQPSLLILDNFEQLLPEGAAIVQTLRARVETLAVLVTSRQRLALAGEQEFRVPPLPVPSPVEGSGLMVDGPAKTGRSDPSTINPQLATLAQCASIRLFLDRAQAVRPDFQVTAANAAAVAALCQRLEGLPLALELAAARAWVLTPSQMLARLSERFELLSGRQPHGPPRHRSLRATLDWSYQLLSPELQRFFARLSVFRGGWTLAAAEAACGETRALEYLEQLRDCSLVMVEETFGIRGGPAGDPAPGTEIRFRLLETVRQYAGERLREQGAEEAVRGSHLQYYLRLAESAASGPAGAGSTMWQEGLDIEHDNLRAALDWALENAREPALRLAAALARFWEERRYLDEGRHRLTAALERAGAARRSLAGAAALARASALALLQEDRQSARALLEESLAIRRELGDRPGLAATLAHLADVAFHRDEYPTARALYEESLAILQELGDQEGIAAALAGLGDVARCEQEYALARSLQEKALLIRRTLGEQHGIAHSLISLGDLLLQQGDAPAARTRYEEALAIRRELGDRGGIADALGQLANAARQQGDYAEARRLRQESLALWRAIGFPMAVVHALGALGHLAREQGEYPEARAYYAESLRLRQELGEIYVIAQSLEDFAELAACERQWARLARLLGAAQALREGIKKALLSSDRVLYDQLFTAARGALGAEAVATAWAEGQAMRSDQAIAYALSRE